LAVWGSGPSGNAAKFCLDSQDPAPPPSQPTSNNQSRKPVHPKLHLSHYGRSLSCSRSYFSAHFSCNFGGRKMNREKGGEREIFPSGVTI
jgi:hypothetical protein